MKKKLGKKEMKIEKFEGGRQDGGAYEEIAIRTEKLHKKCKDIFNPHENGPFGAPM
jgi:hypothetical protein